MKVYREKVEVMKIVKIFISHSWKYENKRDKLVNLLNERKYFDWKDSSVPIDDPLHTNGTDKQLRDKIAEQIRQSSIFIVLAGVYASYSKWIKKEATEIVKWNTESIVKAIRDLT